MGRRNPDPSALPGTRPTLPLSILVAMGGGGLISGTVTTIKALQPTVRIFGIEAAGCPVLLRALEASENRGLDQVTTRVATMACARTEVSIFDIVHDIAS